MVLSIIEIVIGMCRTSVLVRVPVTTTSEILIVSVTSCAKEDRAIESSGTIIVSFVRQVMINRVIYYIVSNVAVL